MGGFILASKFHNMLIPYLIPYIDETKLQITIAYLTVFLTAVIIITALVKMLQKFVELVLLGWLNRLLGILLGLLKGFLLVGLFMFIIQAIPFKLDRGESIRTKLEKESVMYQICDHVKELIILTVPIENQIHLLQEMTKKVSDEESIQNILKSP